MAGAPASPFFFRQPLRYLKWASINKPAYFYSIIVGCVGPVMVVTVPPIRRYMGEEQIAKIPLTYPGTWGMWNGAGEESLSEEEKKSEIWKMGDWEISRVVG
jgi:hypothetical protein